MVARPKRTEGAQRRTVAGLEKTVREVRAERDGALAQQAATAEVLEIINRSSGDPTPVFDAILVRAMRFCDAPFGGLLVPEGDLVRYVAMRNAPKAFADFLGRERVGLKTMLGPDVLKGRVLHLADLSQEEAYRRRIPIAVSAVEDGGARTLITVPMMRDRGLIGAFTLYRQDVRPFTDREVAMAQSFAAQAAIAMENARLITETREALGRQTATAEVLRVISSSPGELKPVFDAMLSNALRLCDAQMGVMLRAEGGLFKTVADLGVPPQFTEFARTTPPFEPPPGTGLFQMVEAMKTIQLADVAEQPAYRSGVPQVVAFVDLGKARTAFFVPMIKDAEVIGAFAIYRQTVRPFSDKQIALVESFADQAVIAIENARLLSELHERTHDLEESLEYQTATSDVLKVISRSAFDLQPVLDTLLQTASQLCNATGGGLTLRDGDVFRYAAMYGLSDELMAILRQRPVVPNRDTLAGRTALEGKVVHLTDLSADPTYNWSQVAATKEVRSIIGVPMLRDDTVIGTFSLARDRVEPFTERQIELVRTFADQAVIAIENARLITETREALGRQTATAEVLRVISSSPGELKPVFDAMLSNALRLCDAQMGLMLRAEGGLFKAVADLGVPPEWSEFARTMPLIEPPPGTGLYQMVEAAKTVQLADVAELPAYRSGVPHVVAFVDLGKARTALFVPMIKDAEVIGAFTIYRQAVRPFSDKQIALVEGFASQAVIAIENARLLSELHERTHDLEESLEYQTATADVLKVISRSTFDLQPVLDAVCETAARLCNASGVGMTMGEGDGQRYVASYSLDEGFVSVLRQRTFSRDRSTIVGRTALEGKVVHIADVAADPDYALSKAATLGKTRTLLGVPLLRDGEVIGTLVLHRERAEPFTERQVELVRTFSDQAAIAIENTRLLTELDKRQSELRVTFDNMGDGVAMFDGERRLAAWNRNFVHILDIDPNWLAAGRTYADLIEYLTARGEFGTSLPPDVDAPDKGAVRPIRYERTRPDGRALEVRRNPVPGGGFVIIYSDITERKRAEAEIGAARDAAEKALADLKAAQANLIQAEKMASLGQLTAGIAHEIKNPLNFVNNFAGLSVELLEELKETAAPGIVSLDEERRGQVEEVVELLTGNLSKIAEHGKRADGIVRSMLAHSRGSSGDRREADINALIEESLNLAYHGARAQDQNFNITLERDYDESVALITLVPQDMTRVFLNLCGNGFYAASRRKDLAGDGFRPILKVATRELGNAVEVRIRDNGSGIPPELRDRLFQPFFTTKPAGEGTGLGLSISYDIVTQQHGGTIAVESEVGDYTEFTIRLPRSR